MTVIEFVPPLPGSWLSAGPAAFRITNHEAAHAVLALAGGIEVRSLRVDNPDVGVGGECNVVVLEDRWLEHLRAVIAGPFVDGAVLPWKPDPGRPGDEGAAGLLVKKLGLGADDWIEAHSIVRNTLARSRPLTRALGTGLPEHGALPGEDVARIASEHPMQEGPEAGW